MVVQMLRLYTQQDSPAGLEQTRHCPTRGQLVGSMWPPAVNVTTDDNSLLEMQPDSVGVEVPGHLTDSRGRSVFISVWTTRASLGLEGRARDPPPQRTDPKSRVLKYADGTGLKDFTET